MRSKARPYPERVKIFLGGLAFLFASAPVHADMAYWDTVRQGKNLAGRTVDADTLKPLKEKGVRLLRLTPNQWETTRKDFLLGDFLGFHRLVPKDLSQLFAVMNLCHEQGFRVVLTTRVLPGLKGSESSLWTDPEMGTLAAEFWRQVAVALKGHPALAAFDTLDKPNPVGAATLVEFHTRIVETIQSIDGNVPVIVESGRSAAPESFRDLAPLSNSQVLYSFHLKEGEPVTAVEEWQKRHHIPDHRLVVGEIENSKSIPGRGWHSFLIDDKVSIVGKN